MPLIFGWNRLGIWVGLRLAKEDLISTSLGTFFLDLFRGFDRFEYRTDIELATATADIRGTDSKSTTYDTPVTLPH